MPDRLEEFLARHHDERPPTKALLLERSRWPESTASTVAFSPTSGVLDSTYHHFLVDGCVVFHILACEHGHERTVAPAVLLPEAARFRRHFEDLFAGTLATSVGDLHTDAATAEIHLFAIGANWIRMGGLASELRAFRDFAWQRLLPATPPPPCATVVLVLRKRTRYGDERGGFGRDTSARGASHSGARRWLDNAEDVVTEVCGLATRRGLPFVEVALEHATLAEQACASNVSTAERAAQ
jgi:hypothetical protein